MIISVLDTETTGSDVEKDSIIELAIGVYKVEGNFSYRQIGDIWTPLISTSKPIHPKAYEVHGISSTTLEGASNFTEVSPKLTAILRKSDLVVAHNGYKFDFPMMAFDYLENELDVPEFVGFDTMMEGRGCTALGKVPNLSELCWAMGVEYDAALAHRADYDTNVLAKAFFKGCKLGYFDLTETLAK